MAALILCLPVGLAGCARETSPATTGTLATRHASPIPGERFGVAAPLSAVGLVPSLPGWSRTAHTRRLVRGPAQVVTARIEGGPVRGLVVYAAAPGGAALRALEPPPSRETIAGEVAREFPSASVSVAPPRRNAYGTYGLAVIAQPAGERCVYGWQWIEGSEAVAGAASLRMRLCSARLSPDDLASGLDGLRLVPAGSFPVARPERQTRSSVRRSPPETSPVAAPALSGPPLEPAYRPAPGLALPPAALRGPGRNAAGSPRAASSDPYR